VSSDAVRTDEPGVGPRNRLAAGASYSEPGRGLSNRPGAWPNLVEEGARLRGARIPGRGGLHGSGQLGHRSRRWFGVRLHPALGSADLQPDGDSSPGAVGQAGNRDRPRSGPGLPRPLLPPGGDFSVAACELAIAACDLAEVIGSAIALNLLFHIPIAVGVVITALDVSYSCSCSRTAGSVCWKHWSLR